jgi:hypothetical protein
MRFDTWKVIESWPRDAKRVCLPVKEEEKCFKKIVLVFLILGDFSFIVDS